MRVLRAIGRRVAGIARLTGLSAWHGLIGFYHSDNLSYAASIAYYALLSLFPFLLLAYTMLGRAAADPQQRTAVFWFVLQYFPKQFDFVTRQLDAFLISDSTFGIAGTLALVWGAVGFFSAISTAVNHAWGVERQRSFWKHRLFSFLMLGIAGLILLVALLLVSASHVVGTSWFAGVLASFPGLLVLRSLAVRYATIASFHPRRRPGATTSSRTRRCGFGTSGSARWSPDCCGRGASRPFRGTSGTCRASRASTDRSRWWSCSSCGCIRRR